MTVQQFHRSTDSLRTRPLWLASSPASTLRVRRVRASPVTGFRITPSSGVLATAGDPDGLLRTSAVTAFSVPRRVLPTTPITTALVNTSVMSSTVQRFDHCVDSLRTSQVLARLVASGDFAPRSASPGAGSPVTGFRTTSSSGVRATDGDADSVLRTSAVTAFSVPRRVLPHHADHHCARQHLGDVQHGATV